MPNQEKNNGGQHSKADLRQMPKFIDEIFLSPESYISPEALRELWNSCYLNPINYSEEMRRAHAPEYDTAFRNAIELSSEERRRPSFCFVYHPARDLSANASDKPAKKSR